MEGGFKFNTAISAIMELVNEIYKSDSVNKEILKTLTILISPFVPHMAEEMWQALGAKESILKVRWPQYEDKFLKVDKVTLVIQVNGKVRDKAEVEVEIDKDRLKDLVLSREIVKKWLEGKPVKSFIVVPNKLVNIVI